MIVIIVHVKKSAKHWWYKNVMVCSTIDKDEYTT
jgi:hypothetical protein